jgi:DNA-binding NarL/FixJ family response regulator
MISVFVVDDHPMVIEGIKALLKSSGIFLFSGSALNGYAALQFLEKTPIDIVLTDINLPDMDGIALCQQIKRQYPTIKVLGLSTFKERSYITRMIQAGASGYVLKNVSAQELEEALEAVMKGKLYLSDEASDMITGQPDQADLPILTSREKEVLKLIADGMTNQEIATALFISPLTVDSHRKSLLAKLDAKNTAAMVKTAMEMGMI